MKKKIYICNSCRMVFDASLGAEDADKVECPYCRSKNLSLSTTRLSILQRLWGSMASGGCSSKGGFS